MCAPIHPCKWATRSQGLLNLSSRHFTRRRGIIVDVSAIIGVTIFPSVVECQRTEWKLGESIFANTRHKSVTIATSLERAVWIIIFYYYESALPFIFRERFGEDQSRQCDENIGNVYFCHVNTHPPMQMSNKISEGVTRPKFMKFLSDVEESSPIFKQ